MGAGAGGSANAGLGAPDQAIDVEHFEAQP